MAQRVRLESQARRDTGRKAQQHLAAHYHYTKFVNKKFNKLTQVLLPIFTISGFLLNSFKMPQYGLPVLLVGQFFWLYAGYQSWKKASQIGILIAAIIILFIHIFGVVNYWFIK